MQNTVAHTAQKRLFDSISLVQTLGFLSSMSLLSGGIALAQTPPTGVVIPEATGDVAPVLESPPAPAVADPVPFVPSAMPAPAPMPETADVPTVVLPTLGAGQGGYDGPTSIVLSERSSGCEAILQNGRPVPGTICAPTIEGGVAAVPSGGGRGQVSAVGVGSLSVISPSSSVWKYYKRTLRPPGVLGNGNIRLIFPLSIPAPISSMFGWRTHPISGDQRFHSGTDLAAPLGTPVLAAFAGRVAIADFLGGYGLTVMLEHNKETQQTLYAHMSEIFVKPGEKVKQGDVIGRVGSTGNSTGPHLHFEFRQLTDDGWVAMDAGQQLEYALAQLIKAMQVAQVKPNRG